MMQHGRYSMLTAGIVYQDQRGPLSTGGRRGERSCATHLFMVKTAAVIQEQTVTELFCKRCKR